MTVYSEFDSTPATVVKDLRAAILADPDWSAQGYDTLIATTSANSNANASTLTFASGSIPSFIVVGSRIRIDPRESGSVEYRDVTSVTATTLGISPSLTYAHSAGTNIYWGSEVLKATTARGAAMIVDLTGASVPLVNRLAIGVYNGWTSPTGSSAGVVTGGQTSKYLYWRSIPGTAPFTMPLHVVVSSSKDHLYINIEGPRGSETGAESSSVGSPRNYFFITDMVPYSLVDTIPTVVCGGSYVDSNTGSVANKSYVVNVSKSLGGTKSWIEGKLLTLQFPVAHGTETVGAQRFTVADDEYYLSPYVVSTDDEGFRGRLNNIFFAGFNSSDNPDGVYPMTGAEVDYNGATYKFSAVTKSSHNVKNWGPLGAVETGGVTTYWRSPIVAIPIA